MAIYSAARNFLFLHVPKSAGTSIRNAMREAAPDAREFHNHIQPDAVAAKIGRTRFEDAYKIAFVRNPWDRAMSLYQFPRSDEANPAHDLTRDQTFSEYLDVYNEKTRGRQTDWTHSGEAQLVDFVGRFETLETDFAKICDQLGLGLGLEGGVELPRLNQSRHGSYRSYYTDAMRLAVANSRAREIEVYAYEF